MMKFLRYCDFFDVKFPFYIGGHPTNNTQFGGLMNILFLISCLLTFLIFSLDDINRLNPITTKSEIPGGEMRVVNHHNSKIWIPWRMVTYEEKFVDHRGILHPIVSLIEGRWNDSFGMDLKYRTLSYKLCNETSMANKTEEYQIDVPLNELFCLEEDDIPWGGSWYGDILYYIEVNLFLCEEGINFNASDPRCTKMSDLLQHRNTSWLFEFYYPVVQFQPTNFDIPMAVIYRSYYYRLSTYANKVERIYIQENILSDDKSLLGTKTYNSSYWGLTNIYGDSYFMPEGIDPLVKSTSSRLYSLVIYMDQGIIFYTRSYKKVFSILSDVFPILNFLLLLFKKFTRIVKLTYAKKSTSELLFENKQLNKKYLNKNYLNDSNKNFKKEESNDIISINIKRNGIFNNNNNNKYEKFINHNSSILNFNADSRKIFEQGNSNSKEFNNTAEKRPSYLVLNKNDNTQSKNQLNDVNLLNMLNMKQLLKKKNTIIDERRKNSIMDLSQFESEIKISKFSKKKNYKKDLFPAFYYFLDIFIDKLIKPRSFCCMNKKYFIVYNFMGQIFDISSHILLVKNFNVFKNIFFHEFNLGNKLEQYTIDKKININDDKLMKEINNDLNEKTCDIFTKSLLI